jgi:CDP-L-myo-inositol myo-inositolphosphotransferase
MALAHLPLHPDVVSILAFLVALAGAWTLAIGAGIAGALLVYAGSVLDGVDGEIARLRIRASAAGALLDGVLDRIADAAIVFGLALWALDRGHDPGLVVGLSIAATAGAMLSMASKDRIAALRMPPPPERWIGFLLGGRDARLAFVTVFALFGRPLLAITAIAITSVVSLVARLLFVRGMLRAWTGAG